MKNPTDAIHTSKKELTMQTAQQSSDRIRDFLWNRLYCPETSLFYDHLSPDGSFSSALPTPEELALDIPNPCGWGTGMEDAMMIAGILLEAVIRRFQVSGNTALCEEARRIFAGMVKCATIGKTPGFLVRCISPADGKSHYSNSSRDQYTHFVFSSLLYFRSELSSPEERADIVRFLTGFAERALANVTEENSYDLLRDDGKVGMVTAMRGPTVWPHEAARLAMFYAGAWAVSGDEKWLRIYREHRDEAIEGSAKLKTDPRPVQVFALYQMQLSLEVLRSADPDPEYRNRIAEVMRLPAAHALEALPMWAAMKPFEGRVYNEPWRERPLHYPRWCRKPLGGKPYFVPDYSEEIQQRRRIREAGEAAAIQLMVPGGEFPADQRRALVTVLEKLDIDCFTIYAPVMLHLAWCLLMAHEAGKA